MKQGIQTFLAEAGEAACYALCVIEIAQRSLWGGQKIDPVDALYRGIERGCIHYNEKDQDDNDNFFVKAPDLFLSILTGNRWAVEKAGPDYAPARGEYVVDRWERVKTGTVTAHFRLPDWDSLVDSQTVKYGRIASRRVFRRIG
jgi:hypothetical protein